MHRSYTHRAGAGPARSTEAVQPCTYQYAARARRMGRPAHALLAFSRAWPRSCAAPRTSSGLWQGQQGSRRSSAPPPPRATARRDATLRTATRSSASSMPHDRRIRVSVIPSTARSSGLTERCVMSALRARPDQDRAPRGRAGSGRRTKLRQLARPPPLKRRGAYGISESDSTPPSDSASAKSWTWSKKRRAVARSPLMRNEIMPPKPDCCRHASSCCGCEGSPAGWPGGSHAPHCLGDDGGQALAVRCTPFPTWNGRRTWINDLGHVRRRLEEARDRKGVALVLLHAHVKRFQAAVGQEAIKRGRDGADGWIARTGRRGGGGEGSTGRYGGRITLRCPVSAAAARTETTRRRKGRHRSEGSRCAWPGPRCWLRRNP